jgi:ketosteroid isomerase-like protein
VRPKDVVAGFLAAWNRHDARALAALFAERAEFVSAVGAWWKRYRTPAGAVGRAPPSGLAPWEWRVR